MQDEQWEREALREIALEGIKERRRARRWGIFFKLLLFIYLFLLLAMTPSCHWRGASISTTRHTAVVDLDGVILPGAQADADNVIAGLDAAFRAAGVVGVVLDINSPGGSPVQASRINDEIRRLRGLHPKIPVYAVCEDICASGAYYAAVASDKIYVNKASMVGSIGVLMDGFGFTGLMDKLGIQRRLYTAGAHKGFLDPFSAQNPNDVKIVQGMLDDVHQQFIDAVKKGRGSRLAKNDQLFSGLVWTGDRAVALGLADGYGDVDYVARSVLHAAHTVNYTKRRDLLERLADRFGASVSRGVEQLFLQAHGFW